MMYSIPVVRFCAKILEPVLFMYGCRKNLPNIETLQNANVTVIDNRGKEIKCT